MGIRGAVKPKLTQPYYPGGSKRQDDEESIAPKHGYNIETLDLKLVSDYMRQSIIETKRLDIVEFKLMYKDAYIYNLSQTSEGVEYLNNAWRLTLTEPDRAALRARFGKKKGK